MRTTGRWAGAGFALLLAAATARAEHPIPPEYPTDEGLARAAQNPVSDLISVPFQDIIGFGVGPQREVANVLNIQPVVPFHLTADWNLISRTILPIVTMPNFDGGGSTTGLGNVTATAFLSPASPGAVIWGAGPVATFPTATSPQLGSQSTWGLGPSVVLLTTPTPWVLGVLANNVWSVAGAKANTFLLQYFVNYNFESGWYLTTGPIITANWEAPSGQQWDVPFGGGAGRIVWIGPLPFNLTAQAYYHPIRPEFGPNWTVRLTATLLLPRSMFF